MTSESSPQSSSSTQAKSRKQGVARWRWLFVPAFVLLVGAAVYGWRLHATPPATLPAATNTPGGGKWGGGKGGMGAMPVAVATATKQSLDVTRNALGNVVPLETVSILAQVSGQLTQVGFKEGQMVHKGDFLFQIDPRPYEATLAQARGQLAKDQALLEEARMDLQRYQDLLQKKSITRQQAEDQKWVVQQAEGTVRVDQAQVDAAQLNVNFCHIVSPVEGRVGLRLVDPGNLVQANGSTALAVVTRLHPMNVVFALPEDDIPDVMGRLRQGGKMSVEALDRSGSRLLDKGTLAAVDSQINTSTGTVNLKATFANSKDTLFPNQFVNVVLHIDTLKDALVIPSAGVLRGGQGSYAYVVKSDNSVVMTPIKVGVAQGGMVAVLSGLSEGDRVVIDGADKLRDGAKVSVPDDFKAGGHDSAGQGDSKHAVPDGNTARPAQDGARAADDHGERGREHGGEHHHGHGHKADSTTP